MPNAPLVNFFGQPGACGFIPPSIRKRSKSDVLIAFDAEKNLPICNKEGFCVEVPIGQEGELLFLLARGYTSQSEQNQQNELQKSFNTHRPQDAVITDHDPLNPHYVPYRGYNDKQQSEKKVYKNVFELNDRWFSTGDLLRLDEEGLIDTLSPV